MRENSLSFIQSRRINLDLFDTTFFKGHFVFRYSIVVFVVLLVSMHSQCAFAQPTVVSDFKKVPVPPSPNASSLGKFGDIPVSPSTGIPDISIPIYSYNDKQKELNVDVSLRYHAGGHKVEDMASNVGFGWALSAGGVIMRTMKGLPDDMPSGYLKTPPLPLFNTAGIDHTLVNNISSTLYPNTSQGICLQNSYSSFGIIKHIAENTYDSEADIFNLSVGGINEKFFFDKNGLPVFLTPNNLHIEYTYGSNNYYIEKFTITDSKGVSYFFDILEHTQTDNAIEPSVPAPPMYISAWYLSKTRSADKKDSILFAYQNTLDLSYEAGLTVSVRSVKGPGSPQTQFTYSYNTTHVYHAQRISKITLPDKTAVDFYYDHNREDYTGDKALTSIKLSGVQHEKLFRLNYGYFVSDNCYVGGIPCSAPPGSPNNWQKRLKLLSIQEESGANVLPPYLFTYNTTSLPFRNSKDQDWWGYSNGGLTGGLMSSATALSVLGYDRLPSLTHCKGWILEKITYPTGGSTQFTYELNEGMNEGAVKPIGGLRIQKIEDYEPLTNATYTRTYTYTKPDNTTSGLLITIPSYSAFDNSIVFNDPEDNLFLGKDIYLNESLNPTQTLSYFNGSPVVYTRVKEEQYAAGVTNGYKIYEFSSGATGLMHDYVYPFIQKQDLTWERGLPLKTTTYNSLNVPLTSEENEYQTISTIPPTSDAATRNLVVGMYRWQNLGSLDQYIYGARYYYLLRGKSQLIKSIKQEYTASGGPIQTISEYTYDGSYYLPKVTKTVDSKGKTTEVKQYYPFDYDTTTYPLMGQLMLKNRVAEQISVEEWVTEGGNSGIRSILVNDYSMINAGMIKHTKTSILETDRIIPLDEIGEFNPDTMYRSTAIKEKVNILKYDARGRAIEFRFEGNEKQSLIWGDHNESPMATIINAEFDDVAFTSFETNEKGNWIFFGIPAVDATAPTGRKVYVASDGVSKSINSNKKYIISLWRKGNVSISNASLHRTGKVIDNWIYEEYLVTNASTVNITGTGVIDELRLFPSTARMVSYTYNSRCQKINESNVSGTISRYEYDPFGRLRTILDENKNVLKKFDYHYKQ